MNNEELPTQTEDHNNLRRPRILVIGVGGGGINAINRLKWVGVDGARLVAIHTDAEHLELIYADEKVLIGEPILHGHNSGGSVEKGRLSALMHSDKIKELFVSIDLCFIIVGMGGGTGTGAGPVIAKMAKEMGTLVIGVVTFPLKVERTRWQQAEKGLIEMSEVSNTVIALDYNLLAKYTPDTPVGYIFSVMDQLILEIVKQFIESITTPSLIPLGIEDIRKIMGDGGLAIPVYGLSDLSSNIDAIVHECINNPLWNWNYSEATGCLFLIQTDLGLTIRQLDEIIHAFLETVNIRGNFICGARVNNQFEGKILLTSIITGLRNSEPLLMGGCQTEIKRLYKKVFVSYASADVNEVLGRLQGIQKIAPEMEFFLDKKSLRSGKYWEDELQKAIESADAFYLFWSDNAKKSKWVEREWRFALKLKGLDFIEPFPLVTPDECPPPPELSKKHFNDWHLYFKKNEGSK